MTTAAITKTNDGQVASPKPLTASIRARAALAFALVMVLALACTSTLPRLAAENPPSRSERFTFSQIEMGTKFTLTFYAEDVEAANTASAAAFARIGELNALLSDYDEASELSRLSASSPHKTPVPVSDELWTVLTHAQRLARQTDGAFDVTVGPVVRLWRRARRQRELPESERLAQELAAVGFENVALEESGQTVQLQATGMRLDLGGIAKGYAADEALSVLQDHGITRALVDAGGDVVAGDPPPGESAWRIAIAMPTVEMPTTTIPTVSGRNEQAADAKSRYVFLANAAVAQSGDTWQSVEIDGRRYSHIVDPRTGIGLTNQLAVTVIAPDGISADSLASALSVLEAERGLQLIEELEETEALLVPRPEENAPPEEHASSGWKAFERRQ